MKKRLLKIGALLITTMMTVSLVGCGNKTQSNQKTAIEKKENKKVIYTSFYPIYDFTKKIVGDKADVINLVPVGAEPHDYDLTAQDRKNLEKADAIIYSGAGMEEWIDDLKKSMKDDKFVEASMKLELLKGHHEHEHEDADEHEESDKDEHDEEHEEGLDPHVWLNPKNAKVQLNNIKDYMVKIDPENKSYYENNYEKYAKEFDELDKEYKEKLAPFKDKHIVVSHEAFGYLCKEYGLKQLGIEGLSPESEPSPKKMAEIVEFVKKNGIKTIFFEELVSPKVSEAIAKETGAKVQMLNPLEGLSKEDLDAGKDYIAIMKENLINLVNSF